MKTSELIGPALDWAVHVTLGNSLASCDYWLEKYEDEDRRPGCESYSTDWAQGGPIIEREEIAVIPIPKDKTWIAQPGHTAPIGFCWCGTTPLIAAMRCYVASQLGDEIKVPNDLA